MKKPETKKPKIAEMTLHYNTKMGTWFGSKFDGKSTLEISHKDLSDFFGIKVAYGKLHLTASKEDFEGAIPIRIAIEAYEEGEVRSAMGGLPRTTIPVRKYWTQITASRTKDPNRDTYGANVRWLSRVGGFRAGNQKLGERVIHTIYLRVEKKVQTPAEDLVDVFSENTDTIRRNLESLLKSGQRLYWAKRDYELKDLDLAAIIREGGPLMETLEAAARIYEKFVKPLKDLHGRE